MSPFRSACEGSTPYLQAKSVESVQAGAKLRSTRYPRARALEGPCHRGNRE